MTEQAEDRDAEMILEIHPYLGIGALKLGAPAGDLRRIIGAPYTSLRKTPDAESHTEAFDTLGIHTHFGPDGTCQAIEVFSPTVPVFMGRELIGQPFGTLCDWLGMLDPEVRVDDFSVLSIELGFGVYAPSARKAREAPCESVLVFSPSYPL